MSNIMFNERIQSEIQKLLEEGKTIKEISTLLKLSLLQLTIYVKTMQLNKTNTFQIRKRGE